MEKVELTLTDNNVRKLLNGHPIQLSAKQLAENKHYIIVHPLTAKKIKTAISKKKGVRINMTKDELAESGDGFMDILKSIGRAANWVKSNVIDSNLYQTAVKPVVRGVVDSAIAASRPFVGPLAPAVSTAVDMIGTKTNAFGIAPKSGRKPKAKPKATKPKAKPKAKMSAGSFLLN